MSTSLDKRLTALQTIQTMLCQLNYQMIEEIKIKDERSIDRILSEPKFRLDLIKSILPAVIKNTDQPTTHKPQKTPVPVQRQNEEKAGKSETTIEAARIAEQLQSVSSREEGKKILEENCKTKQQLEVIAEHLKIPIGKLRKDQLAEKIIQDTIGYRIDSMIIQEHQWDK